MPYLFPRLVAKGVSMTADCDLESIGKGDVLLVRHWGAGSETRPVDTVVLCQYRTPDDRLFTAIRDAFAAVYRIGDCLAPRRTGVSIYEGEKLGREL
jgi:2,4-dienoyl-CoA reductase (NADPH2)